VITEYCDKLLPKCYHTVIADSALAALGKNQLSAGVELTFAYMWNKLSVLSIRFPMLLDSFLVDRLLWSPFQVTKILASKPVNLFDLVISKEKVMLDKFYKAELQQKCFIRNEKVDKELKISHKPHLSLVTCTATSGEVFSC